MTAAPSPTTAVTRGNTISAEIAFTIGGIITSTAVVALNQLVANQGFDFLSLSYWFVIPAGAVIGGAVAASGYFAVALLTHRLPDRRMAIEMALIGLSTWIFSRWLGYATMTLKDGTRVADIVSFWNYFQLRIEHMQLSLSAGSEGFTTGELGALGYAREVLQALGFVAGGFLTWSMLSDREICPTCQRYAKTKALFNGAASADRFDAVTAAAGVTFPGLVEQAESTLGQQPFRGISLAICSCAKCSTQWARPSLYYGTGQTPASVRLSPYTMDVEFCDRLRASSKLPDLPA